MPRLGTLGFPPFTRAVKQLVIANIAVYLVMFGLGMFSPGTANWATLHFSLIPYAVVHGWVWQLVTYSFLHAGLTHILFNMLSLWMFGSSLEQQWGAQRFYEFYFFCVVGAALTTCGAAYLHLLGMSPLAATVGASGGIYGLLVAFGILFALMRVYIYGIFPIQARWLAIIWVALALFGAMSERGGINNVAHLGGALFGFIYLKALPPRGLKLATSEGYYGLRNRYQRWKRRRAAKKFEVFMKEHDRSRYFDEYGNFRDPSGKNDNGRKDDRGGWVN